LEFWSSEEQAPSPLAVAKTEGLREPAGMDSSSPTKARVSGLEETPSPVACVQGTRVKIHLYCPCSLLLFRSPPLESSSRLPTRCLCLTSPSYSLSCCKLHWMAIRSPRTSCGRPERNLPNWPDWLRSNSKWT